jgi:hypothetical protein
VKAHGKGAAQINGAVRLLNDLRLVSDRNEWVKYPSDLPSIVRSKTYVEEYAYYVNNGLYDIRLVDSALFQFKHLSDDDVSYCYYEPPFEAPTYEEFVAETLGAAFAAENTVGDSFREEYEQAVDTAPLRKSVTPIRYDYSPALYEPGVHPAAHLHIGVDNELRIYARRLMHPMSFVLFVMRHIYPDSWRRFIQRADAPIICRAVRDDLALVADAFATDLDRLHVILE